MPGNSRGVAWGQILLGALLTFAGSVAFFHYTNRTADLVYDAFPPGQIATEGSHLTIYNVRVENIGDKQAENVQVHLSIPEGGLINDVQIEPSLAAIDHSVQRRTERAVQILFPLLNPREGSKFSLLITDGAAAPLSIEVRSPGLSGRPRPPDGRDAISLFGVIVAPIAFVIAAAALVLMLRFTQFQNFLKSAYSEQLRALRTRPTTDAKPAVSDNDLAQILTSKPYRFYFNPRLGAGLSKTKVMQFGADGTILQGSNKNETKWRIKNGLFEFINQLDRVNARFYYSPADQRFYQVDDVDTDAVSRFNIRDQYLIPESLVSAKSS